MWNWEGETCVWKSVGKSERLKRRETILIRLCRDYRRDWRWKGPLFFYNRKEWMWTSGGKKLRWHVDTLFFPSIAVFTLALLKEVSYLMRVSYKKGFWKKPLFGFFFRHVERSCFNYRLFDMGQVDLPQFCASDFIIARFCLIVFVLWNSWEKELGNLFFFCWRREDSEMGGSRNIWTVLSGK